ncbi:hypothetical protein ACOSP7_025770 [Xanthoceras sorbifolium]
MQIRAKIQATKKGSLTITEYVLKLRTMADSLAAAGQPMSERDLLLNVLQGLGSEYDAVIVNITSQHGISLQDAQFQLMSYEARLDHYNSSTSLALATASAQFAQSNNSRGGTNQYNRGRRGRGRGTGRGRGIICQLCGKTGHYSAICYSRFDQNFQGFKPQVNQGGGFQGQARCSTGSNFQNNFQHQGNYHNNYQGNVVQSSGGYQINTGGYPMNAAHPNAAYIASPSTVAGPTWYIDSGATNHITADLNNLSVKNEYKGNERLAVGNGNLLPISHFGCSVIPSQKSASKPLYLNNILHVPNITKNLLSISQFTKDNNAIIEFNADCCLIKDQNSKRTLLHGIQRDELYHLDLPLQSFKAKSCYGSTTQPHSMSVNF